MFSVENVRKESCNPNPRASPQENMPGWKFRREWFVCVSARKPFWKRHVPATCPWSIIGVCITQMTRQSIVSSHFEMLRDEVQISSQCPNHKEKTIRQRSEPIVVPLLVGWSEEYVIGSTVRVKPPKRPLEAPYNIFPHDFLLEINLWVRYRSNMTLQRYT